MKKTIMPTKMQHITHFYLMGIFKILLVTAILITISFLSLAAALYFTDFSENYIKQSTLIASFGCLLTGNILGSIIHRHNLINNSYFVKENRIKLYLMCNCLYSVILYFIIMVIL